MRFATILPRIEVPLRSALQTPLHILNALAARVDRRHLAVLGDFVADASGFGVGYVGGRAAFRPGGEIFGRGVEIFVGQGDEIGAVGGPHFGGQA